VLPLAVVALTLLVVTGEAMSALSLTLVFFLGSWRAGRT
jgi:hypothetical protein